MGKIEYPIMDNKLKQRSEATSFLDHWIFLVGYWIFKNEEDWLGSNQGNMHMAVFFVGWGLPHQITVAPRDGGASPTLQVVTQGRRFVNDAVNYIDRIV